MADDETEIARIVAEFFTAFTNHHAPAPLHKLRRLLVSDAPIVNIKSGVAVVERLEPFIERRASLLSSPALAQFEEREVDSSTSVAGPLAHRLSHYRKTWSDHGEPRAGSGTKSFQLIATSEGWLINAIAWRDDESY